MKRIPVKTSAPSTKPKRLTQTGTNKAGKRISTKSVTDENSFTISFSILEKGRVFSYSVNGSMQSKGIIKIER